MLKQTLALVGLTLSLSSHAAILDLGTITRDTATGLDWLDVTETRGLSYNQVTDQLGVGGDYEGYRYATTKEWDQLIINFGFIGSSPDCGLGRLHCYESYGSDSPIIEQMIKTLGDTVAADMDEHMHTASTGPEGAGGTIGFIYSNNPGERLIAYIFDGELLGQPDMDTFDSVVTVQGAANSDYTNQGIGSFLVAPSAVPIPAAGWLFMSALIGLLGKKRLSR